MQYTEACLMTSFPPCWFPKPVLCEWKRCLCIEAKVFLVVICTFYFLSFVTCDLCLDIRSIHDIEERVLRLLTGFLPFTRTNRSVYGLGKWQEKFSLVYHLCTSVSFTGKRPRTPETVIKDVFQETELPFQMFRCSGKSSAETTKKVMFHYFPTGLSGNLLKW